MRFFQKNLQPNLVARPYNENIESYRGICALFVMLNHGTVHSSLLIDGLHMPPFVFYLSSPYLSVLVFFCISGYAIGVSNNKPHFSISTYLKKRAIRLYPILIASILLCVVATQLFPWKIILGNLLFLQNTLPYFGHYFAIFENFPIWSLNHEALYYLLFIVIVFIKPRIWLLLTLMIIASILSIHTPPGTEFLPFYLNGFYFWLVGLLFAWGIVDQKHFTGNKVNLISIVFLHLCLTHLALGSIILSILHINTNNNFSALFHLPFCVMLMGQLMGYENKWLKINRILCYVLPTFLFAYLAFAGRIFDNERWIMCFIFWIMAIAFYTETKYSAWVNKNLLFFGRISYGLYLFHIPIAMLVKNYYPVSSFDVPVKYALWISITLLLAYFFELKLQDRIKNYFFKK